MDARICPYLGTLDANNRREAALVFPSFENQCLVSGAAELIMLGDQASYCLSGGCTTCPRYAATAQTPADAAHSYVPFFATAEDAWQTGGPGAGVVGLDNLDAFDADNNPHTANRRRWAWVGASLIFLTVLACGSLTTAYTGWEWVSREYSANLDAGRVNTLTAGSAPAAPAVYVVMTATPLAATAPPTVPVVMPGNLAAATDPTSIAVFPAAVTPTPIVLDPNAAAVAPPISAAQGDDAAPLVDVQLLVPTRRPTPVFDLPTSTPLPLAPSETPSLTPAPLGTPVLVFGPDKKELAKGECTLVRWNVQNVREVYYENLPMNGQGEREECLNDHNETYTLMVVLGNGQSQVITTTVTYLPPTPTITPTPSFTPEPQYTPTWTPAPPTATPAPAIFYATNLAVNGSDSIACAPGQSCEVGLLVTNGGEAVDNLSVRLVTPGPFAVQVCRPDGVCGADYVPINSVGPGNTAFVTARFTVPGDAVAQTTGGFGFQAFSEGSGRAVSSSVITINVTVP